MTIDKTPHLRSTKKSRILRVAGVSALSCSVMLGMVSMPSAFAAEPKVDLGTSSSYSVLGGQSVTNTGNSVLAQDLGVNPGTSITGFPPGLVLGTTHATDAHSSLAQSDLVKAYDDTAGRAPTATIDGDLAGRTLVGGVYKASSELELSGTLTLDAQNDPNTVWIFQVGSALTTGSASSIELINGAQACNVYWQVGSSATLGTASEFKGSILALTSVTVTNEANVEGRVLARNGSVTLDDNTFTSPSCATALPEPEPTNPPTEPPVEPTEPPAEPEPTVPPTEPTLPPEGETPPPGDETPPGDTPPGETPPGETPPGETPPDNAPPGDSSTPPGDGTPPDNAPPGDSSTPPGDGNGNPPGDSSTQLAKTGASSTLLFAGGGLMMLVLGSVALIASRKVA